MADYQEELRDFVASDVAKLHGCKTDKERDVRQRIIDRKSAAFIVRWNRSKNAQKELEARQTAADASGMPELLHMSPEEIAEIAAARESLDADVLEKLTEADMNEKMSIYSFRQLCTVLQKLNRLEHFVRDLEAWVEGTYVPEAMKSKDTNENSQELKVAAYIRTLLKEREEKLRRIENRRANIAATAAELKRGHHQEQRQHEEINATYERSTSPRRNNESDEDDELKDLRVHTSQSSGESAMLLGKVNKLQSERSELLRLISIARGDVKVLETNLKTEHSQKTTKCRTHRRVTDELHRANAALITSMEMLMQQLNLEYYGLNGPAAKAPKTIK